MKKSHTNSVLDAISSGKIRMRSSWSIWLEKIGTGGLIAGVVALLALISGLITFWFTANRDLLGTQYGWYGTATFAESFPYIPAVLFALCFLILAVLLRKFDFSYKKPLLSILAIILITLAGTSYVMNRESVSQAFIRRGAGYMGMMRANGANFIIGTVTNISGNTLTVTTDDGETVSVKTTDTTHFPFGMPKTGDSIRVVGFRDGSDFTAIGIRVFPDPDAGTQGFGKGMHQGRGMGKGFRNSR